ncbi:MAG: transcriptional repressor [Candidatus Marinimicrobia bacterium]|nr:transcriptional repressor [Candidatus Neomarinimicrobiota bacterium]MCF7851449.1 transcriptional repressor [Candidatus Neomarinimicrobiota bacterium]MCF7905485.1 transcriptional repressor [Candidatus Neomarinimicrobiota bacterium]
MEAPTYRFSKQRQLVLDIVRELKTHPVAETVYQQAKESIPNISLGTVYRNLNQLVDMGQISALKDKGLVRYEGNMEDHDHFYCNTCGSWYDVDVLNDMTIKVLTSGQKFRVDTINLELSGTCEACLNS